MKANVNHFRDNCTEKVNFEKKNQSETDVYNDIPAKRPKWPRMQHFVRFNEEKNNHASAWIE